MAIKKPSETSWLDLANRALARLNQNLIKSFDEGTNSSLQAELCLSDATQEVLNTNDWKCATRRQYIQPLRDKTADDKYVYSFPNDFIRLVSVGEDKKDWEREGHGLVSPLKKDILIRYVAFPNEPWTMDPLLQSAVSLMAAYKMSLILTADTVLQQQLYAEASAAIASARLGESQGVPDEIYSTNDWKGEY